MQEAMEALPFRTEEVLLFQLEVVEAFSLQAQEVLLFRTGMEVPLF